MVEFIVIAAMILVILGTLPVTLPLALVGLAFYLYVHHTDRGHQWWVQVRYRKQLRDIARDEKRRTSRWRYRA